MSVLSPNRSQQCTNEACIAEVIRLTQPRQSRHIVRVLVSFQLDTAMVILTEEALS